MGLEKLLRGLYGTVPQIDMDLQIARSRVARPMTFDFFALADGIKRNNVGTAGISLRVAAEIRDRKVVLRPTGQSFPLEGPVPADAAERVRWFEVIAWEDPAKTALKPVEGPPHFEK